MYTNIKQKIKAFFNGGRSSEQSKGITEYNYETPTLIPKNVDDITPQQLQLLTSCTDAVLFKIKDVNAIVKVLSVYDGDTITVAMFINEYLYKFNCRLNKYDAPEIKPKKSENEVLKNIEKEYGEKSKTFLSNLILNKIVYIYITKDTDPYGRLLIDLYLNVSDVQNSNSVNDLMINKHYGHPYSGDKKKPFSSYKDWYGFTI